MGRRLNLGHLSEEECEQVLKVIQRDFELRQKEKERLSKIEEEVDGECKKRAILAKQKAFNENCCMRCFSRFIFIINQKVQCYQCKFYVCKNCSEYDSNRREYICNVCKKQRELQNQSLNWFYDSVKNRFKRFGSAKVVRSLYKRRLDSDSETEVHIDPPLYSSEPIGQRPRSGLQGLFDSQKEIRNDDEEVTEETDNKRCPKRTFSTPYSCPVGTGRETFDQVKQEELNTFKNCLKCLLEDICHTLDTHSPRPGDILKQERDLLSVQRFQLISLLSNLSQSLHIAIDNQDPSLNKTSPVAKHQLVKDILVSEVEQMTDKHVTLASVTKDGTQSYEEQLANIILNKVVDDYHQKALQQARDEERDMQRAFNKLTNRVTLEQIKDKYVSESETDVTSSQVDETMSDLDSRPPGNGRATHDAAAPRAGPRASADRRPAQSPRDSDSGIVTSPTTERAPNSRQTSDESDEQPRDWSHDYSTKSVPEFGNGATPDDGVRGHGLADGKDGGRLRAETTSTREANQNAPAPHTGIRLDLVPDDQEIDDIVTKNLIDDEWSLVESRPSRVLSDDENDIGQFQQQQQQQQQPAGKSSSSIPISRQQNNGNNLSDSDTTVGDAKPPSDSKRQSLVEDVFDDSDTDGGHRVPLPSFGTARRLSFESGDLDDISSHQENDSDCVSTFSTEISFGRTWSLSRGRGPFGDQTKISAYDNFGEKKVGRDIEGPVIMLVPDGLDRSNSVKVGDRDLDELSDLSENATHSEVSSAEESDTLEDDDCSKLNENLEDMPRAGRATSQRTERRRSSLTATPTGRSQNNDGSETDKKTPTPDTKSVISAEDLLALEVVSTEKEETDPKFLVRPQDVTVLEGEVARFSCKLTGTEPLDVFWHKEGEDVVQLNEDEFCDVRREDSVFYLDVYNTRLTDQSQILCIGVNDQGRCIQGVRLFVQENPGVKKAPEFLKPLRDIEVKVGSRVKFRVKLSGYPQPKVNWFKDGKKLSNCEQYRIEKQGNRDYVLSINYVTLDDDAEYMVTAKNIVGETQTSAQLVVNEDGSDVEFSSLGSSRVSLTFSPQPEPLPPSQPATRTDVTSTDNTSGLYPDTEELLRLAEKVSRTRGDVTSTASKMLRSAGQMSTLHQQLDEMDTKLNNIETEVKVTGHVEKETDAYKEIYRDKILQEHEALKTSASAVRNITSAALNVLQTTDEVIQANKAKQQQQQQQVKPKTGLPPGGEEAELVELKLTYAEFERLYSVGKITRNQMHTGMVPRSLYEACMEYLKTERGVQEQSRRSHDLVVDDLPSSVDCGLKRVDSKRYRRDYVINRDKMTAEQNRKDSGPEHTDVIKSTPAGTRENANERINEAQQQIYLAAGRVSHLQQKIEHLEDKVNDAEDKDAISDLEEQVSQTAAQVKTSEKKVSLVEQQVRALESLSKSESQQKTPVKDGTRPRHVSERAKVIKEMKLEPLVTSASSDARQSADKAHSPAPSLTSPTESNRSPAVSDKSPAVSDKSPAVSDKSPAVSDRSPAAGDRTSSADNRSPGACSKTVAGSARPSSCSRTPAANVQDKTVDLKSPAANRTAGDSAAESGSPSPRKTSINLHGESSADVLPESRTEVEPDICLPSVKSLKSKFDQPPSGNDGQEVGSSFKRVYSLTGRDLPRTVREKLKQNRANKVVNPNIRSTEAVSTPSLSSVFEPAEGDTHLPQSSTPKTNIGRSQSLTSDNKVAGAEPTPSAASLNLSSISDIDASSPRTSGGDQKKDKERGSRHQADGGQTSKQQAEQGSASSDRRPPVKVSVSRQNSSTVLARAAFWNTRINHELASDAAVDVERFPVMPVESFKSADETH